MLRYEQGLVDGEKYRFDHEPRHSSSGLTSFMSIGLPILFTYLYIRYSRKNFPAGSFADMFPFSPFGSRSFRTPIGNTKFSDIIGIPEAKTQVQELVEMLTNPEKFTRLGGRLPKGLLLTGEPGTGKTLLAKAAASEGNLAFFSCTGSDFIEVLAGSGPKRIRELFKEARKDSPAIVFIDEFDAIGSRIMDGKGTGRGGRIHGEENRTINQLLAELDGISTHNSSPILVMAATNFQESIDPALLREGRFDRKIHIDMPDLSTRVELFSHYLGKIYTGDPTGFQKTAKTKDSSFSPEGDNTNTADASNGALALRLGHLTPGISPATVAAIVNEAALACGRQNASVVNSEMLLEAVDQVLYGRPHRPRQSTEGCWYTAIQLTGRAFLIWNLPHLTEVLKISLQPRGSSLGYVKRTGVEAHEYQTNVSLFSELIAMVSSRAAMEVILNESSIQEGEELQQATAYAIKLVLCFGMSFNVGLLTTPPQYAEAGRLFANFSASHQQQVEKEAQKLLLLAHEVAGRYLRENTEKVQKVAKLLLEKRECTGEKLKEIWGERPSINQVHSYLSGLLVVTLGDFIKNEKEIVDSLTDISDKAE